MTMAIKSRAARSVPERKDRMDKATLLHVLQNTQSLPFASRDGVKRRTIYESGDVRGRGTGRFHIDFAAYDGGTAEEISRVLIDELEREGILTRAFADKPAIDAWVLSPSPHCEDGATQRFVGSVD